MTETRGFYTPEPVSGCPSLTEIINKWAAGTTAPDAVQAQERVAELEAENARIQATAQETIRLCKEAAELRVAALRARITVLEAALTEIRDLAPAELSEMADRALKGEAQK